MAYTHDNSVPMLQQIRNLLLEMLTGLGDQQSSQPTGDATLVIDTASTYTFVAVQSYLTVQLDPAKTTARLAVRWKAGPVGWSKWDAILTATGERRIVSPPGMQTNGVAVMSNEALVFKTDFSIMGWA